MVGRYDRLWNQHLNAKLDVDVAKKKVDELTAANAVRERELHNLERDLATRKFMIEAEEAGVDLTDPLNLPGLRLKQGGTLISPDNRFVTDYMQKVFKVNSAGVDSMSDNLRDAMEAAVGDVMEVLPPWARETLMKANSLYEIEFSSSNSNTYLLSLIHI